MRNFSTQNMGSVSKCMIALTISYVDDIRGKCQKSNCIFYFFRKNLICNLQLQVIRITQHTRHISIHQISSKLVVNILTGSYSTFLHLYSTSLLEKFCQAIKKTEFTSASIYQINFDLYNVCEN